MRAIVNSSPLIFLAKLGKLDILKELFDEIIIPEAVYNEAVVEGSSHEESSIIKNTEWIKVEKVRNYQLVRFLMEFIDYGESEVIVLAIEKNADIVILDDKDARKIARGFGLKVTGTIGVLMLAKRRGLIKEVKPLIEELIREGFRISNDLLKAILKEMNEV